MSGHSSPQGPPARSSPSSVPRGKEEEEHTRATPPLSFFKKGRGRQVTRLSLYRGSRIIGLDNSAGENNCYINAVIQSMYHLRLFRKAFMDSIEQHRDDCAFPSGGDSDVEEGARKDSCVDESLACIFCAIKHMFIKMQRGENIKIKADAIRVALNKSNEGRFHWGTMEDAAECYQALVDGLHCNATGADGCQEGMQCNHGCLTQRVFGIWFTRIGFCDTCNYASDPSDFTMNSDFLGALYLEALKDKLFPEECGCPESSPCSGAATPTTEKKKDRWYRRIIHKIKNEDGNDRAKTLGKYNEGRVIEDDGSCNKFCQVLLEASDCTPQKCTKEGCSGTVSYQRHLNSVPLVYTVSLMWDSFSTSKEQIKKIMSVLPEYIDLNILYNGLEEVSRERCLLPVQTIVCFYGRHYIALAYKQREQCWKSIDDSNVKEVGKTWTEAKEYIVKNKLMPTLLFFSNQEECRDASAPRKLSRQESLEYHEMEKVYRTEYKQLESQSKDLSLSNKK
eukprot:Nk52_evm3s214 gene=Nk52_evmTU3s214